MDWGYRIQGPIWWCHQDIDSTIQAPVSGLAIRRPASKPRILDLDTSEESWVDCDRKELVVSLLIINLALLRKSRNGENRGKP